MEINLEELIRQLLIEMQKETALTPEEKKQLKQYFEERLIIGRNNNE